MDTKQISQNNMLEIFKLSGVLGIFIAGVVGFYYFDSDLYSAIVLLASFVLGIVILLILVHKRLSHTIELYLLGYI